MVAVLWREPIGIRKNTSKYNMCIVMYFAVFYVFQWTPITILPPLGQREGVWMEKEALLLVHSHCFAGRGRAAA